MLKDFKAFVLRGNVVDLAVGIVVGAAFGAVVQSLVGDVITPLITIPGDTNFGDLAVEIGGGTIYYGNFINALVAFLTVAAAVFFLVVRPVNSLMARHKTEPEVEATTRDCPWCLSAIPLAARACAFCTREVPPPPAPRAPDAAAGEGAPGAHDEHGASAPPG